MLKGSGRPASVFAPLCPADEPNCDMAEDIEPYFRVVCLIFSLHQLAIEIFQMKKDGFVAYIQQRASKIDLFSLVTNQLVLVLLWADVEIEKVRLFASVACVVLWIQLFFWFRLFDSLAQYVDLIFSTVNDIRNFMYV